MDIFDKSLTLFINTLCDENCEYCINDLNIDLIKNKDINLNKIHLLNDIDFNIYKYINIQGGEPGLCNLQNLKILFDYLNKKINYKNIWILTNGLFLEKYIKYFFNYNYLYHIVSFEKFKKYDNIKIIYNYVLTINNYTDLIKILENNKEIQIEISIDLFIKDYSIDYYNILVNLFNSYFYNLKFDEKINKNNILKSYKNFKTYINLYKISNNRNEVVYLI
jgi:molybdenum cofactor biosynthesis enzyme MoaA